MFNVWVPAFLLTMLFWEWNPSTSFSATNEFKDGFEEPECRLEELTGMPPIRAPDAIELDRTQPHSGTACCRLDAKLWRPETLTGGSYKLDHFIECIDEIRFWVRTKKITEIGVRIQDASEQNFLNRSIPIEANGRWQEVVVKLDELLKGEHSEGLKDGKMHGFPKEFGICIFEDGLPDDEVHSLWIDDITLKLKPFPDVTVFPFELSQAAARPGYGLELTHHWKSGPLGRNCSFTVSMIDNAGEEICGDYSATPTSAAEWNGEVKYQRMFNIPPDTEEGEYRVVVSFEQSYPSLPIPLKGTDGLVEHASGQFVVAKVRVANDAPIPELPSATLDLNDFKLTFSDDFTSAKPSISARGTGTKWASRWPNDEYKYGGTTIYLDPKSDFPFAVKDGVLQIKLRQKSEESWEGGILTTLNGFSGGFSQKLGYFEVRAKMPQTPGAHVTAALRAAPDEYGMCRFDIPFVDYIEDGSHSIYTALDGFALEYPHDTYNETFPIAAALKDFHNYGVLIEKDFLTYYFDGHPLRRHPTPKVLSEPVGVCMWIQSPIQESSSPRPKNATFEIDHVRVYARKK